MIKHFVRYELPDDQADLTMAMKGRDCWFALDDILELLRSKLKYGNLKPLEIKTIRSIQSEIINILDDRNIYLNEVE